MQPQGCTRIGILFVYAFMCTGKWGRIIMLHRYITSLYIAFLIGCKCEACTNSSMSCMARKRISKCNKNQYSLNNNGFCSIESINQFFIKKKYFLIRNRIYCFISISTRPIESVCLCGLSESADIEVNYNCINLHRKGATMQSSYNLDTDNTDPIRRIKRNHSVPRFDQFAKLH